MHFLFYTLISLFVKSGFVHINALFFKICMSGV